MQSDNMTTDIWDNRHQHNFQALFWLKPETDLTLLAEISEAAVAYMNAASPKVLRWCSDSCSCCSCLPSEHSYDCQLPFPCLFACPMLPLNCTSDTLHPSGQACMSVISTRGSHSENHLTFNSIRLAVAHMYRPPKNVQAPMQPAPDVTASPSHDNQGQSLSNSQSPHVLLIQHTVAAITT